MLEPYGGARVEVVYDVLGGAAGLGLSAWAGYAFGVASRSRAGSVYWFANGVGLVLGVVVATLGFRYDLSWLWIAGIGVMAGSLTGLKYGAGRVVDLARRGPSRRDRGEG